MPLMRCFCLRPCGDKITEFEETIDLPTELALEPEVV
jgi:hypothetical protein